MAEIFELFQQAMTNGSRSTALKPLGWALGILIFGLISASRTGVSAAIITALAVLTTLTVLLYLAAYIYFMFKNPDALRSEKYAIQKLAIEKRLVGDSAIGIISVENLPIATTQPHQQLKE